MADKSKAGLPPPPGWESAIAAKLQGLLGKVGLANDPSSLFEQPVAYSRITRTPIYPGGNVEGAAGTYYPASDKMFIDSKYLDGASNSPIPHESAHAIYSKGAKQYAPELAAAVPPFVKTVIDDVPDLYPPQANVADAPRYNQMIANEGLGYGIGVSYATPYIEKVASKLPPAMAAQLLRLHHNALAVNNLQDRAAAAANSAVSK